MDKLIQFSTWKKASVLLALNFLIQIIILLVMYPRISTTLQPLDVQFGLSAEIITEFLTEIGAAGRQVYFLNEATVDMLFPLVYSFAYALLLIELLKASHLINTSFKFLLWVPFGIGLSDLMENILLLTAIQRFPMQSDFAVQVLTLANATKHSLTLVGLGLIVAFAGIVVVTKTRQRLDRHAD